MRCPRLKAPPVACRRCGFRPRSRGVHQVVVFDPAAGRWEAHGFRLVISDLCATCADEVGEE